MEAGSREERLSEMVSRYQALLLKVCYAYLCDADQAQDAVQDTFLKAYLGLDGLRGEHGEKVWLVQIARNTCRDMRRSAWFRHVDRRVTPEDLPEAAGCATEGEKELTAAISQEQAFAIAREAALAAGAKQSYVDDNQLHTLFYDVTDPARPLWKVLINLLFGAQDTEHPYDPTTPWGYFAVIDAHTGELLQLTERTVNTDIREIV